MSLERLDARQIGRYQILDVIGRGGMGVVYLGLDTSIDRKVAIKMLLGGEGDEQKNILARFHQEARSTANLQHRNIVTVYALDDFEGIPYMVMEYLEGKSIAEMLATREQISLVDRLSLTCQICDGLQYAHDREIVHRDIKPANVLVLKDGTAKIVDFGIARVGRNESLTRTGQIIGSVYYMSPEQISGSLIDNRSDIYSVGVLLFQFLTGELPFKAGDTDPQGTFMKILNDPVPLLGKYLSSFPPLLDQILAKAMAKSPEDRYQAIEDLGYELSNVLDGLKSEMKDEFLSQAQAAVERRDWETARTKLQEVLRFDKRNVKATELFQIVRQEIQRQQRSSQIEQLRSQADLALSALQYEEAFACIEQAQRLDPNNAELGHLATRIQDQIRRGKELAGTLSRAQAALYAGDLDEAKIAVDQALQIDAENTEARMLEALINKELKDRSRRSQFQGLIDEARQSISSRNFISALQLLEKAQHIDPSDSNIRELVNWAARGYEQEKQRNELRKFTEDIGKLLAESRFVDALEVCDIALGRFPQDAPLLKLHELAKRQRDLAHRRQAVDETASKARSLVESGLDEEAIHLLNEALKNFPDEQNLITLLAMTRLELENRTQEQEEREKQLNTLSTFPLSSTTSDKHREAMEHLSALSDGLKQRLPVLQLVRLATEARDAAKLTELEDRQKSQLSLALAEVETRATRRTKDLAELSELREVISRTNSSVELDAAVERGGILAEQYKNDDAVRTSRDAIQAVAAQRREIRNDAGAQITRILEASKDNQDLAELQQSQQKVQELSKPWLGDPYIRSLVDQHASYLEDAQRSRNQALEEVSRLTQSLEKARSEGQIRFLRDQAIMLTSELKDAEVLRSLQDMHRTADGRSQRLNETVAAFNQVLTRIASIQSLAELDRCKADAERSIGAADEFEEASDLMRRIQRALEEQQKDYRRRSATLEQLIASSASAGHAELDSIVAREHLLAGKYKDDPALKELQDRLASAVALQRATLTETALTEESLAPPEEESLQEITAEQSLNAYNQPIKVKTAIVAAPDNKRSTSWVWWAASTVGLLAAGTSGAIFLIPKSVSIGTTPARALIAADGLECYSPCTLRLRPGTHAVSATLDGFETLHSSLAVPYFDSKPLELTLQASNQRQSGVQLPPVDALSTSAKTGQVLIQTPVAGALIFVDGSSGASGQTDSNGRYLLATTEGTHQIRVEKSGYAGSLAQPVSVRSNQKSSLSINLKQLSQSAAVGAANASLSPTVATPTKQLPAQQVQPPTPVQSFLVIEAPAGAEIHVDQQSRGQSTGSALRSPVEAGQHTVEAFLAGYKPWKQTITIEAGKQAEVAITLSPVPAAPVAQPSPAPQIPSSQSQPAISEETRKEVQQLVDRYSAAVVRRDMKQLHDVWPDIPKGELEVLKNLSKDHKGVSLVLTVEKVNLLEGTESAVVRCKQVLQYDGKRSEDNVTFYLGKLGNSWIIHQIPRTN